MAYIQVDKHFFWTCRYCSSKGVNQWSFNSLNKDKKYKSATPMKLNSSTTVWPIKKQQCVICSEAERSDWMKFELQLKASINLFFYCWIFLDVCVIETNGDGKRRTLTYWNTNAVFCNHCRLVSYRCLNWQIINFSPTFSLCVVIEKDFIILAVSKN